MPDFNKYRANKNLKEYIDAVFEAFLFRIGGPAQWILDDWKYTMDPSWQSYFQQAQKLGIVDQSIGYIVSNPFEDFRTKNAQGELVLTSLLDDWTGGGYMPRGFCYDHEVNKCWRSTGAEVIATGVNLVDSLAEFSLNTWQKFHRTTSIYTADWFVESTDRERHYTYFTNINRPVSQGGEGVQRPVIGAWYPQSLPKQYTNVSQIMADLLVPTPQQVANYLWFGYEANAWQFSNAVKIGAETIGVDCSISLENKATFFSNFGFLRCRECRVFRGRVCRHRCGVNEWRG